MIDCNNVICDVNSQILTISKKMYNKLGYDKSIKELEDLEFYPFLFKRLFLQAEPQRISAARSLSEN